jgi:hypothetical protein
MQVIKKLGDRVEKEHDQFLRDSQRLEDRSGISADGTGGTNGITSNVDFESLVGNANGPTVKPDTAIDSNANWDDDVWGSIFSTNTVNQFIKKLIYALTGLTDYGIATTISIPYNTISTCCYISYFSPTSKQHDEDQFIPNSFVKP